MIEYIFVYQKEWATSSVSALQDMLLHEKWKCSKLCI